MHWLFNWLEAKSKCSEINIHTSTVSISFRSISVSTRGFITGRIALRFYNFSIGISIQINHMMSLCLPELMLLAYSMWDSYTKC